MRVSWLFLIVSIVLSFGCNSCSESENKLKADLVKFNGFYTSIEMKGGEINPNHLPLELLDSIKGDVNGVDIEYLSDMPNGYILTFNIKYSSYNALVVSLLNEDYSISDYRKYPNGTGWQNYFQDTITSIGYFGTDSIRVEIMHPNSENEPDFRVDGIRKEVLKITDELKLVNK